MKTLAIALLGMICTLPALSQTTNFNGWAAGFGMFKLKNNFSIQSDIQVRSNAKVENAQTFLLRAGLNYNTSKAVMLSAGYAFIENRRILSGISDYIPEHRIWQQLMITHSVAGFIPLAHRFRLEQRFLANPILDNNNLKVDDYSFASRTRYFMRGIIPLSGEKNFTKGFFGAVQNEVFLNIGNTSAVNGKTFDQNRLYLAGGYRFSKKFDAEMGYMNQYISGRNDTRTNNHILQLAGYVRL